MTSLTLLSIIQAAATDEGLTLGEILSDIPHDAPSIFIYILVAFSVGLVIRTGRKKNPGNTAGNV